MDILEVESVVTEIKSSVDGCNSIIYPLCYEWDREKNQELDNRTIEIT